MLLTGAWKLKNVFAPHKFPPIFSQLDSSAWHINLFCVFSGGPSTGRNRLSRLTTAWISSQKYCANRCATTTACKTVQVSQISRNKFSRCTLIFTRDFWQTYAIIFYITTERAIQRGKECQQNYINSCFSQLLSFSPQEQPFSLHQPCNKNLLSCTEREWETDEIVCALNFIYLTVCLAPLREGREERQRVRCGRLKETLEKCFHMAENKEETKEKNPAAAKCGRQVAILHRIKHFIEREWGKLLSIIVESSPFCGGCLHLKFSLPFFCCFVENFMLIRTPFIADHGNRHQNEHQNATRNVWMVYSTHRYKIYRLMRPPCLWGCF